MKMLISICLLVLASDIVHSIGPEKMEYTLNLMKEGDEFINVGYYDDIVLVMGNTGAGKSTLVQFLAGDNDNLISKEIGSGTGEFIIEDLHDKVSNNSTLVSKTIFPELVYDDKTDTPYYDCPGFSDTRNSSIDIASSYFIHKVIDHAKNLKNLFVVNYSSVKEGVDRIDFLKLLRHIATLFKNVEKFRNSISMVVSKIENSYVKQGDQLVLVSDDKIIGNIANFLRNAKQSLLEMIKTEEGQKKVVYENAIKLVDILLTKKNDVYTKLGIFRRPDEAGPLSKIRLMQENKARLQKIVDIATYDAKDDTDFGYTISEESQNDITDLVEQISERIAQHATTVGNEIKKNFEYQEKNFRDINILQKYFATGNEGFIEMMKSLDTITKPKQLVQAFTKCLSILSVPHSEDNLSSIIRYDNFLEFLQLISAKKLSLKPLEWIKSLESISKYLDDSSNTYTFFIDTFVKLGEWSVQKDHSKFNVDNLRAQINDLESRNVSIIGSSFKPFLEEIYYEEIKQGYTIRGYDSIKNSEFSPMKRAVFFEMLDLTLVKKISMNCVNSNQLVVRGDYVKLSEVLNTPVCPQKFVSLEIFALNKLFVDSDLVHVNPNVQVKMVSPTWEIIDSRKIHLIGDSAANHPEAKAADGESPTNGAITGRAGGNGAHGRVGLRGLSGGSFMGVATKIINGQNLAVASIGGNGSPGQNGGNGGNGENGKDVEWQFLYSKKHGNIFNKKKLHYYKQDGGAGGIGGTAGNGALGGLGGPASDIQIVEFAEPTKVNMQKINGQNGANGAGGKGGVGGTSGNRCTGNTKQRSNVGISGGKHWEHISCHKDKSGDGGNGADAANGDGRENQDNVVVIPDKVGIINEFKALLTENLNNRIKSYYLKEFTSKLDVDPTIKDLYDTLGFTRELQNLENRFYRLSDGVDFLPIYQSLLERILGYAQSPKEHEKSLQFKKVLNYVYSATLSKICSFKNDDDNSLIIDIKEYLNYAIGNINRLQKTANKVIITEINQNYKQKIDLKINEGNYFITNNILPEIKKIGDDMDKKIDGLVEEILVLQDQAEVQKQELIKKQREAVKAAERGLNIGIIKGIGQVASYFGPWGQAVSTVINVATSVSKSLNLDDSNEDIRSKIPEGVRSLLGSTKSLIEELRNNKLEVLDKQLELLGEEEPKNSEHLAEIKKALNDIKGDQNIKTGNEKVQKAQTVLQDKLQKLKDIKDNVTDKVKEAIGFIEGLSKYSKIADISMDIYKKYKNDKKKIAVFGEAIKEKDREIEGLRAYEKEIHDIMIPLLEKMVNDLQNVIDKLGTQSQISLDISKWQVQGSIRDMKTKMRRFTQGFQAQEELELNFNKLNEAMDILINVFDRIQVYNEQKTLADYISDIASVGSTNIKIDDPTLNAAVTRLDLIIKSNIVLSNYRSAVNGLKQYIFPFADFYLAEFNLPLDIVVENTIDDLVTKAVLQIESLKLKLVKSDATINRKHDQYLHHGEFHSNGNSVEPFIKWDSDEYKNAIFRLLSGEEVVIKADVTRGSRKNAVKFNQIDLQFKSELPEVEKSVNDILQSYDLNITHMGNSYYRCDSKFYVIPSESQSIRYSFAKNANGEPIRKNVVYDKLKNSDYMLSPYAMWSIRLMNPLRSGFQQLQSYANQIKVELSGYGQYLIPGSDICNTDLERYYRIDKSITANI